MGRLTTRLPLMLDIQAEVTDGTVQAVRVVAPSGQRQDITQYLDEDQMATIQRRESMDKIGTNPHEHEWAAKVDSQWHSELEEDVYCVHCGMPGQKNLETGEVFWPAT